MKKTGFKLLLSGVALAACAATLSTTTYAWYTSNTDVAASGMNGAIAGGADSGLLISKEGSKFSSSITFTEKDIKGTKASDSDTYTGGLTHNGSLLEPLEYRSDKTLGTLDSAKPSATTDEYLQFSVYVKTTASDLPMNGDTKATEIPVYFKSLTITNTTAALPEYNVLSDYTVTGGTASGWTAPKGKYSVDATRALNLGLAVGAQQESGNTSVIGATPLSLNNYVTARTADEKNLATTGVDALDYYNQVMHGGDVTEAGAPDTTQFEKRPEGYAPVELATKDGKQSGDVALKVVSITNVETVYEIVFTVWLDGWDKYCFDACRGQSFSFDFELTTNADIATVYAASSYATTPTVSA